MSRRGRNPAAGNGEGVDDAELAGTDVADQGVTEAPDQVSLADINAARQRLLVKQGVTPEKPGPNPAKLG